MFRTSTTADKQTDHLSDLLQRFDALQQRYDALNAKFNLNKPKVEAAQAAAMQSILTSQAMGMGAVFRK